MRPKPKGERELYGIDPKKIEDGWLGLGEKYAGWNPPTKKEQDSVAFQVYEERKGVHPELTQDDDWREAKKRIDDEKIGKFLSGLVAAKVESTPLRK